MQAIEIGKGIQIGLPDLVRGVSRLDTQALKTVLAELNQVLVHRGEPSGDETQLLRKIREIVPPSVVRRYKKLRAAQPSISEKEHQELLLLTDFMEEKSAERIQLMGELAVIQHLTLADLAEKLRLRDFYA